jgi:hypothetical protein
MKTKNLFCADEQKLTSHELAVDNNGEIIATCACGRFVKFPAGFTADQVKNFIVEHEDANKLSKEALLVEESRKASEEVIDTVANVTGKATIEESPE